MPAATKEVIDTLSKACAYGDIDKLAQFLDSDPTCVNKPDEQGHYPLQWAALNNRVQEINLLLCRGALINIQDHTGQTALHWGAVRASLPVIEVLLRANADFELRDNRGYTVAHVAAQYGQTAVLYHLALKWNMDVDLPDYDGRTPLHWAAYKGYADTIRLLLVLDTRYMLPDKEGCTALHWAAIKGNGEACTVLLQGGSTSVLTYKDITGSTPAQLAVEKGHRYLGLHLAEYKQKHEGSNGWCTKNGKCGWMMSTQLCPIIWLVGFLLMASFAYTVMPHQGEPAIPGWMMTLSWASLVVAALGMVALYKTTTLDPGFIPTGWELHSKREQTPEPQEHARKGLLSHHLKALDSPALWAGNWHQLCVSCRIVRPLRAKHCAVTDRCIEVFDHYCPWVGNAIGKGNRHWFIVFLWMELFSMVASGIIGIIQVRRYMRLEDWSTSNLVWMIAFEVLDCFVGISVAALAVAQASQVARNITTNELANWHRYKYLQTPDGNFHNPFSKGCWANCQEAFNPHAVPTAPVYLYKDGSSSKPPSNGGSHAFPFSR